MFGDKKLKEQNTILKETNSKLDSENSFLKSQKKILVEKLGTILKIKNEDITKCVETKMEPNTYFFLASKKTSLVLPTGHTAFDVEEFKLLMVKEHYYNYTKIANHQTKNTLLQKVHLFLFTKEFLFINISFGIIVTIIPTFGFFVGHFCLQNSKTAKTEEK